MKYKRAFGVNMQELFNEKLLRVQDKVAKGGTCLARRKMSQTQ
jgi:hypothetical protein